MIYRFRAVAGLASVFGIVLLVGCGRVQQTAVESETNAVVVVQTENSATTNAPAPVINATVNAAVERQPAVAVPLNGFFDRIMKKPFGIYITPKTSPIQPEKFQGYHTGADAETASAEATEDLPVFSIADGTAVVAGYVNGYGGVVMIRSVVDGETVTALYGHIRLSSVSLKRGQTVSRGELIALLGTGFSSETDGERQHLHLGLLKGAVINYRGYVSKSSDLSGWIDPVAWLHAHGL